MANSGKRLIKATSARRQEITSRVHNIVRGLQGALANGVAGSLGGGAKAPESRLVSAKDGLPHSVARAYSPTNVARARRHQPERLGREESSASACAIASDLEGASAAIETVAGSSLCPRACAASDSWNTGPSATDSRTAEGGR